MPINQFVILARCHNVPIVTKISVYNAIVDFFCRMVNVFSSAELVFMVITMALVKIVILLVALVQVNQMTNVKLVILVGYYSNVPLLVTQDVTMDNIWIINNVGIVPPNAIHVRQHKVALFVRMVTFYCKTNVLLLHIVGSSYTLMQAHQLVIRVR